MKRIFKDRLLRLAVHLEKGELGHEVFDFNCWNHTPGSQSTVVSDYDEKGCGTNGCAIGECPYAFPRRWELRVREPRLKKCNLPTEVAARAFFGLTDLELSFLFLPHAGELKGTLVLYGKERLRESATKERVAARLRWFVRQKELHNE